MEIKDILKARRIELGFTLDDIANQVGVSSPTVSRWESGDIQNMKRDKIVKLAAALDLSPAVIMGWEKPGSFSNIKNLSTPDAYAVPVLGRICCGDGTFTEDSYDGYFVLDKSIHADFCLEARGDSMTDAGIDDGDRVFLRKTTEYEDGRIYGVLMKGEDLASLKKVYRLDDKLMLQPCNSEYHPQIVPKDDVFIIGECVGVYKII